MRSKGRVGALSGEEERREFASCSGWCDAAAGGVAVCALGVFEVRAALRALVERRFEEVVKLRITL